MVKDEAGGKIIEEFVDLRATLYSYKTYEGKGEKKCTGIRIISCEKEYNS